MIGIQSTLSFVRDRLTPGQRYGLGLTVALLAAALAFWGFVEVIESWTRQEDIYRVDAWAAGLAHTVASPASTAFFRAVTFGGSAWVAIPLVLAVAVALWRRRDRRAVALVVTSFGAGEALLYGIKVFFQRARPELQLVAEHGYSFPSGHSFTAAVVFGLLAVLTWHRTRSVGLRVGGTVMLLLLIVLVGASRIYLGVHYATDVLGGFALAAGWLAAAVAIARFVAPAHVDDALRPGGRSRS